MLSVLEKNDLLDEAERLFSEGDYEGVLLFVDSAESRGLIIPIEIGLLAALADSRLGRKREAIDRARQLLGRETLLEDSRTFRRLSNLHGSLLIEFGQLEASRVALLKVSALAYQADDQLMIAATTMNLGVIADIRCEWAISIAAFERAAAAYHRLGELASVAVCHHNLGLAYTQMGRWGNADAHLLYAMDLSAGKTMERQRLATQMVRALVLDEIGDHKLAEATSLWVVKQAKRLSDEWLQGEGLRVVGKIQVRMKQLRQARSALLQALNLARRTGAVMLQAEVCEELAVLETRSGHPKRANAFLQTSCVLFASMTADARIERAKARVLHVQQD